MSTTTELPCPPAAAKAGLAKRLLWFVALYAAGVAVTGAVAYGLRSILL